MTFQKTLGKYRKHAFSERDKSDHFERIVKVESYVVASSTIFISSSVNPYNS